MENVEKKDQPEDVFPGYNPDGSLPEGWEEDTVNYDTITSAKVAEAIKLGDAFVPANEAEQELKDEIAEAPKGAIIDVPE